MFTKFHVSVLSILEIRLLSKKIGVNWFCLNRRYIKKMDKKMDKRLKIKKTIKWLEKPKSCEQQL